MTADEMPRLSEILDRADRLDDLVAHAEDECPPLCDLACAVADDVRALVREVRYLLLLGPVVYREEHES